MLRHGLSLLTVANIHHVVFRLSFHSSDNTLFKITLTLIALLSTASALDSVADDRELAACSGCHPGTYGPCMHNGVNNNVCFGLQGGKCPSGSSLCGGGGTGGGYDDKSLYEQCTVSATRPAFLMRFVLRGRFCARILLVSTLYGVGRWTLSALPMLLSVPLRPPSSPVKERSGTNVVSVSTTVTMPRMPQEKRTLVAPRNLHSVSTESVLPARASPRATSRS